MEKFKPRKFIKLNMKDFKNLFAGIKMPTVKKLEGLKVDCGYGNWVSEPLSMPINPNRDTGNYINIPITPKQLENKLGKIFKSFKNIEPFVSIEKPIPIFIMGPPGIGKTEIVQNVGEKYGLKVKRFIASTLDISQLIGLPTPSLNSNIIKWYILEDFYNLGTQGAGEIYFFDEINTGEPKIQEMLYRLLFEGKLSKIDISYALRIGAGYRIPDYENVQKIGLPMATKFPIYLLDPDLESWLEWAKENDINDYILYYLYQVFLQTKGINDPRWFCINQKMPGVGLATPRSWTNLSKLMNIGLDEKEDILATLGALPGSLFSEWYMNAKKISSEKNI